VVNGRDAEAVGQAVERIRDSSIGFEGSLAEAAHSRK
jgi:hypothetical protein